MTSITDGRHDDLYPHGNRHNGKYDKDATFAYQIVETDRTFTYDVAGKLLTATETEDNYSTYVSIRSSMTLWVTPYLHGENFERDGCGVAQI